MRKAIQLFLGVVAAVSGAHVLAVDEAVYDVAPIGSNLVEVSHDVCRVLHDIVVL